MKKGLSCANADGIAEGAEVRSTNLNPTVFFTRLFCPRVKFGKTKYKLNLLIISLAYLFNKWPELQKYYTQIT